MTAPPKHTKLHAAAANCLAAALLLKTIGYDDCANDLRAQSDYLNAEASYELEQLEGNKWHGK